MAPRVHWWWKWRRPRAELASAVAGTLALLAPATAQPQAQADGFGIGVARPAAGQGRPQTGLAVIPLQVRTRRGARVTYNVEVAATPTQQATGMMWRTAMAPKSGMLFPMDPPRQTAFWMRNTLIPLDIIYIGTDRRIIRIAGSATPRSDAMIPSGGKAAAVLELAGGEAARVGLKPGDRVVW